MFETHLFEKELLLILYEIEKEALREEEDLKLMKAHENLGNKWVEITKVLPLRCAGNIKNRWNATNRKCLNAIKESNIPKKMGLVLILLLLVK